MVEMSLKGKQRVFMTGNEVAAWGAIAAKADIMFGYPITPQTEVMHYWTRLAPKFNKEFLQTEDEISAGFTTIGGVMTGKRAFTGTAGPGSVLMQESAVMAEMMRIPIVYLIQQRGGPSTATVIYSQQETTLTAFGGNGEGFRVVYSPATHQEMFDYIIKAFNTAWKYRFPTFVLGDGYQAKMRESMVLYDPEEQGVEFVKPYPLVGNAEEEGFHHLRNTYNTEEELEKVLQAHISDYQKMWPEVVEYDAQEFADADILVISHGVVSRSALVACKQLRKLGEKVGYFRPITVRPFPEKQLREVAAKASMILVAESAQGQLYRMVVEAMYGMTVPIQTMFRPGVGITPEEIYDQVKGLSKTRKG